MVSSSFTVFTDIPDPSNATPGLFNSRFNIISTNLDQLNTDVIPTINVKTFGAVGDGTTDDTAAIQAAFDFAHTGGNLYDAHIHFPPGHYKVTTSPITWTTVTTGKMRLRVTGAGIKTTQVVQTTANVDLFQIGNVNKLLFDVFFSDMLIGTVAGTGTVLNMSRLAHVELNRISCSSTGFYGIWLEGSLICRRCHIDST